jgi:hypothetical protein
MRVPVVVTSALPVATMCMHTNEMGSAAADVRNAEVGSSSLLPSTTFSQQFRDFLTLSQRRRWPSRPTLTTVLR